jgi:regulator of sigma E protease
MEIIIKIVQVVLSLSILVIVHELGHFLFARLFKMRVDKFYLFFNPSFSLLRAKRINGKWEFSSFSTAVPEHWKNHPEATEFGIGWVPLGGYCKIAGMIDESMDKEQLQQEPKPWEFRTKPAWQRFFVMIGGVLFNLVLAILIYAGILFTWGDSYLANKDAIYGIKVNELSHELGFRDGDKIMAFDGHPIERFAELQIDLVRQQASAATIVRGIDTITIAIDQQHIPAMLRQSNMFNVYVPFVIKSIPDTSQNVNSGLQPNDMLLAINGIEAGSIEEVQELLEKSKDQTITVSILREDTIKSLSLAVNHDGHIGVVLKNPSELFTITVKDYSLLSAIPGGVERGYKTVKNYISELKLIFTPKTEAYKSVGSFIAIGKIFPSNWNWYAFWNITAFLSIMLAVLNILPIPGLDGGHTLFVLYEMITRRKPSERFLEHATYFGLLFLLGIMILAFGNDIYRLFK